MRANAIKTVVAILCGVTISYASQWNAPKLAPNINLSYSDSPVAVTKIGDIYKYYSDGVFRYRYLGNYNWKSEGEECAGIIADYFTVSPWGHEGFCFLADYNFYKITSADGLTWHQTELLTSWNRNPLYPLGMTCAWFGSGKWLYVLYSDWTVWGAPEPYDNPRVVDLDPSGNHKIDGLTVRWTGNYMVVHDFKDTEGLFELTGFGDNWSPQNPIPEINTYYNRHPHFPVLGILNGKNILLFSMWTNGSDYDVYYSLGSSNPAISPTSLGRLKASYY